MGGPPPRQMGYQQQYPGPLGQYSGGQGYPGPSPWDAPQGHGAGYGPASGSAYGQQNPYGQAQYAHQHAGGSQYSSHGAGYYQQQQQGYAEPGQHAPPQAAHANQVRPSCL